MKRLTIAEDMDSIVSYRLGREGQPRELTSTGIAIVLRAKLLGELGFLVKSLIAVTFVSRSVPLRVVDGGPNDVLTTVVDCYIANLMTETMKIFSG